MRPSPVLEYAVELAEVTGPAAQGVRATHSARRRQPMDRDDVRRDGAATAPTSSSVTSRSSRCRTSRIRERTCWSRTSSGSAAAAWPTCWRSGGPTAWTRSCVRPGSRTSCSPASRPEVLCWHVGGTTDSFGPDLQPVTNGLGYSRTATARTTTPRSSDGRSTRAWSPRASCRLGWATDDGVGTAFRRHRTRRRRFRPAGCLRLAGGSGRQRQPCRGTGDPDHTSPARPP